MIDRAEVKNANGWRLFIYDEHGNYCDDGCSNCLNETARVVKVNDNYVVVDYESNGSRRLYFDDHAHLIKSEMR